MPSTELNIDVYTPFFQWATPGTQNMPSKNRFGRGAGNFFSGMKTINRAQYCRLHLIFLDRTPVKFFLLGVRGVFFHKSKVQTIRLKKDKI